MTRSPDNRKNGFDFFRALAVSFMAGAFFCAPVFGSFAQNAAQSAHENDGRAIADKALSDIKRNIAISQQRASSLADEVNTLKKDQRTLTEALVKSARIERDLGVDTRESEKRLKDLFIKKHDVEERLRAKRGEFADVLAALERMGLKPPPAILVHPDDALQSIRSAVLLGSVVPEMRARTQELAVTLDELEKVEASVLVEKTRLTEAVEKQKEEKQRLQLLLQEKAKLQKKSELSLEQERRHNQELALRAQSLQDLMVELKRQSQVQSGKGGKETRADSADTGFLPVSGNFTQMRGRLLVPVEGKKVQAYGKTAHSEIYEAEPGAIVTSPAEGVVRYAGSFRSYGQLLIIDVGQNYHIILAGLGKINVSQGQVLLEGEPVGSMGSQLVASAAAFDIGKSSPMLYIEIRKEGKPVDPAPWWARR